MLAGFFFDGITIGRFNLALSRSNSTRAMWDTWDQPENHMRITYDQPAIDPRPLVRGIHIPPPMGIIFEATKPAP